MIYFLLLCLTDTSYDRAVEDDRRGSVPSVTLTRPTFSLSPGDDASTTASAAQSDKNSIASTSDSKVSLCKKMCAVKICRSPVIFMVLQSVQCNAVQYCIVLHYTALCCTMQPCAVWQGARAVLGNALHCKVGVKMRGIAATPYNRKRKTTVIVQYTH